MDNNEKSKKVEEAKKLQKELNELLEEIGLIEEETIENSCNSKCKCKCKSNNKLANPDSKMIKYG
jgi:hypothetical protein